ncbi:hypothetical protein DPMN_151134 [Dreissena polymorpha]|uniref:Uncharacterized protein n=1 Tax=Dreissena polymorpha TaxID=45954 RepID=A0A9D4FGK3_DREPO|nr:hypothetical protein DPMN_151134 [Dreissena polymorpha]
MAQSRSPEITRFYWDKTIIIGKIAPPLGSHVFKAKVTIFELIQYISRTNLLSKFHEDRKINVASRVLTRKNAPPTIIFDLIQIIMGINLLTKCHEDQTINVASRENAPPFGSHVFQANVTIFDLIQDIIETNLMTKFHEDWKINVPSRELKRQMLTPHNAQRTTDIGRRTTDKRRSQKLNMSTLCSVHKENLTLTGNHVFNREDQISDQ